MSGDRAGRVHLDSKGLSSFKIVTAPLGHDFVFWLLVHSVLTTHSEMTFGCQAAAQGAPASTAKVFLFCWRCQMRIPSTDTSASANCATVQTLRPQTSNFHSGT